MDILTTATNWTKAEMVSSAFFILFGVLFLMASLGFWQLGKTEMARAYIVPALVAGTLLLIIGLGIFIPSQARVTSFSVSYNTDSAAFVAAEMARADTVLSQYRIAVYWVIPMIVAACAVLILLVETPIWRASLITVIAMMSVVLVIDTNANARLEAYRSALEHAAR